MARTPAEVSWATAGAVVDGATLLVRPSLVAWIVAPGSKEEGWAVAEGGHQAEIPPDCRCGREWALCAGLGWEGGGCMRRPSRRRSAPTGEGSIDVSVSRGGRKKYDRPAYFDLTFHPTSI